MVPEHTKTKPLYSGASRTIRESKAEPTADLRSGPILTSGKMLPLILFLTVSGLTKVQQNPQTNW
ncbi:hypothetical protein AN641_04250 [Candidatus Epulonipiscioides gigas]|nr:hypothetical protein AN641_04250 [Epulopiscium sp. SCG-C07WGA-EpuloA2]